ncbi:MAG TPA: FAD-binding oxidoreductase [Rubrobacteraceae bacterium]|nr:FAD-binding oxidoreductase [Rubrobacteraceae bacterium]
MSVSEVAQVSVEDLQSIVGREHARDASEADAVDGVAPSFVVEPGTVEEASAVMKLAHEKGLKVTPRGSGTKIGWGNPPSEVDLIVSTARLNRLLEHAAGDLVTRVEAGMKLEDLQKELAGANQMLALDPPEAGATVGGIVAANASGPRRLRYGTVRDLLIGITVVLPNGTVAKAGGKVVKNVAGYDLGKLYTGSLGTLGLIVETIWRLHPIPETSRTVVVEVESPEEAGAAVQSLMHSTLVPTMIEVHRPESNGATVAALIEGIEPGVLAQSVSALELTRLHGDARVLERDEVAGFWRDALKTPWDESGVGLKIGALPAELPNILQLVSDAAERNGLTPRVTGHAATGVTLVGLSGGDDEGYAAMVQELREIIGSGEGSVVVVQGSPELKRKVDAWGAVGDSLPLMRRVKGRFDPGALMNPGRFVGGI